MQFEKASQYIQEVLSTKLSPLLYYHNYAHTMGVLKAAVEIAYDEKITNEEELVLLKTAALYHDSGFITTYDGDTEFEACVIARNILPQFDYSAFQIELICDLIMKTKMPQNPETHLQKILCDADLNYLGHDDFELIGNNLLKELNAMGKNINQKDWNNLQIEFLEAHHYWTPTSISKRENKKAEHLQRLKELVLVKK